MIEVENVCKSINGKKILCDISFSIKSGEIVTYLGQNGAGKTTTINILTTLLKPDSGKITINGYEIEKSSKKIRNIIGYVFEDFGLYPTLNLVDNLNFIGKLYNISDIERKRKIAELIDFFELHEYVKFPITKLSKGSKQKVAIAKALIHDPAILFLDEPTSGLDPFTAKNILNFILSLKKGNKTIFINNGLTDAT
ncbi:MAG: ABC transporter ATP-binding protein [Candidatus Thorarchaeota archaeon]